MRCVLVVCYNARVGSLCDVSCLYGMKLVRVSDVMCPGSMLWCSCWLLMCRVMLVRYEARMCYWCDVPWFFLWCSWVLVMCGVLFVNYESSFLSWCVLSWLSVKRLACSPCMCGHVSVMRILVCCLMVLYCVSHVSSDVERCHSCALFCLCPHALSSNSTVFSSSSGFIFYCYIWFF